MYVPVDGGEINWLSQKLALDDDGYAGVEANRKKARGAKWAMF